jgi:hypothetical protein
VEKILVAIIISILVFSISTVFSLDAKAEPVPNGIIYSVPITLTNTQSVATSAPYQQMISIDSSNYMSYEASNLQNVEFFDSAGSVIYSWLESGNSNSVTNTIYWLNLPNGIAAKSTVTIYLGFAASTTNLFNDQTIGEAPNLSSIYGKYDNGRNVFSFYDDFRGTSLGSLWVDNSAQTENTFTIDNGVTVAPAQAFNNWTSINSVKTFSQGVTEFYGTIPTGDGSATFDGVLVGLICQTGWDSMIGCVAGSYGLITKDGGNWNTAEGLTFGAPNIYSLYVPSSTSSLRLAEVNYGSTISGNSNPLTLPQPIGLQNQRRSGLTLGPIYWIRERAYPPNGMMPTVSVNGQSSSTPQSNSIFSNPLVIAAIIAVVLAGVGATVYFGFAPRGRANAVRSGVTGAVNGRAGESSRAGDENKGSAENEDFGNTEDGNYDPSNDNPNYNPPPHDRLNSQTQAPNQPAQQDQNNYGMGFGSESKMPSNQTTQNPFDNQESHPEAPADNEQQNNSFTSDAESRVTAQGDTQSLTQQTNRTRTQESSNDPETEHSGGEPSSNSGEA